MSVSISPGAVGLVLGAMVLGVPLHQQPHPAPRQSLNLPPLAAIPAGSTMIGSLQTPLGGGVAIPGRPFGDFDERPSRTNVTLPPFWIGVTEVTNAQYEAFDPSHALLRGFEGGYSVGDDEAVVFVSHENATRYCEWLSSHPAANGVVYRLPTELEWERAARAGTSTNFWFGDKFDSTKARATGATCPNACPNLTVAQFEPNPFGLYDTVGNVEEWTSDPYSPYPGASPAGFTPGLKVTRGGSHSNSAEPYYLRAANRAATLPSERASTIGFRVAASTVPQHRDAPSADGQLTTSSSGYGIASGTRVHLAATRVRSPRSTISVAAATATSDPNPDPNTPIFRGPYEYIRFGPDVTETAGGPLFPQHNHAPGMGVLLNGTTLIVGWFSTISESGREPAYAASTLRVDGMASACWEAENAEWANASLLWKAADRGQQTQLFHTDRGSGGVSWYAAVSPQAGYIDATVVRRDLLPKGDGDPRGAGGGGWSNASVVTHTAPPRAAKDGGDTVPAHTNGHIPFERIVPLNINGTPALAMTATYLGAPPSCPSCPVAASSVVLRSLDAGWSWRPTGGVLSGICQFVVLHNGSWLGLGRGGGSFPARPTPTAPGMTQSLSHDGGITWTHGWRPDLWPLGVGVRHVLFRLAEGPLLLVSFTWGSNLTTVSGKTRRFTGLYAALSTDEGASFGVKKPLVDEEGEPRQFPTLDGTPWHMTNATAEPRGYTSARQTDDGMIHVVSSRLSYHFNLAWLQRPAPDAPDAPSPAPPPPSPGPGPTIPNGTWYTARDDWKMHSPSAKRTITALRDTTVRSSAQQLTVYPIKAGWAYVLVAPPQPDPHADGTWVLQCPCTPYS